MNIDFVILAAGKGTRMRGDSPKVLANLGGQPMLQNLINTTNNFKQSKRILVVGYKANEVKKQIKGLSTFKKTRNNIQVNESLKKLQITAKGDENIMPDIIHCVKNNCTLGEISDTLRLVFGEH